MNNKYLLLLTIFCAPLYAVKPLKVKALFEACEKGDYRRTSNLLAQHGMSTVRNEKGQTLLHVASTPEIVRLLLSYGIPTHIADNNGHTPFMTLLHTMDPNARPLKTMILALMAHDTNHPSTPIVHRQIFEWLKKHGGITVCVDGFSSLNYAAMMMSDFVQSGVCPDYCPEDPNDLHTIPEQLKVRTYEREETPHPSDEASQKATQEWSEIRKDAKQLVHMIGELKGELKKTVSTWYDESDSDSDSDDMYLSTLACHNAIHSNALWDV